MADKNNPYDDNLPIREDSSVEITDSRKPEIETVKPIFRPPEKFSKPIEPHWTLIWLIVTALIVVAWMFLFVYFSHHQAPFAAPIK